MKIVIVSLLLTVAFSACATGFWNPLDNACVTGTIVLTKCVHGHHRIYITQTPQQTGVF